MELSISEVADLERVSTDKALIGLYRYWDAKRRERHFPSRRDIDPLEFTFAIGHVSLVEVEADNRFRYRLVSTSVTDRLGYEMTGKSIDDLLDDDARAYLRDLYTRVVTVREPLFEKSTRVHDNYLWQHEALVLPLSNDNETIHMLLIFRRAYNPQLRPH